RLDHLDGALRADLALLLPELGAPSAGGGDRNRLFDAVAELARQLAAAAPLAVLLDDVHWIDEASAALLHYVVRALDGGRVVVALAGGGGALSDSLEGMIVDRLGRIDERARDLLPWAAALGRNFRPELLARAAGVAPAELLGALAELERHGVVRAAEAADGG